MAVELDVEIFDDVSIVGLDDVDAVHQIPRLDQDAVEIHRVVRRKPEVASRDIFVETARLETDRKNVLLSNQETPAIAAAADPFDWPHRPGFGRQPVAD